jgi:hypothetical protein
LSVTNNRLLPFIRQLPQTPMLTKFACLPSTYAG